MLWQSSRSCLHLWNGSKRSGGIEPCFQDSDVLLCVTEGGRSGWVDTGTSLNTVSTALCVKSKGPRLLQAQPLVPEEEHPCPWMTQRLIHKGDDVGEKKSFLPVLASVATSWIFVVPNHCVHTRTVLWQDEAETCSPAGW